MPGSTPSTPPRRTTARVRAAAARERGSDSTARLRAQNTEAWPSKRKIAAVDVGLAQQHAGVVGQIARREVVRAVDDDVVVAHDAPARSRGQRLVVGLDPHVRIDVERGGPAPTPVSAGPASSVPWMIWRCRLLSSTTSKSTRPMRPTPAAARYMTSGEPSPPAPTASTLRGLELLLPGHADFGHDQVPAVAADLLVAQVQARRQRHRAEHLRHANPRRRRRHPPAIGGARHDEERVGQAVEIGERVLAYRFGRISAASRRSARRQTVRAR